MPKKNLRQETAPKIVVSTMSKKDFAMPIPYLGQLSLQIGTRINCIMKNLLPYCNIRFVSYTKCKISNFSSFKDKIPLFVRSGIV